MFLFFLAVRTCEKNLPTDLTQDIQKSLPILRKLDRCLRVLENVRQFFNCFSILVRVDMKASSLEISLVVNGSITPVFFFSENNLFRLNGIKEKIDRLRY